MKIKAIIILLLFTCKLTYAQLTVASLFALKKTAENIVSETGNLIDTQRQQALIDLSALVSYAFDRLDGTLDDLDRKLSKKEQNLYAQLDKKIFNSLTIVTLSN